MKVLNKNDNREYDIDLKKINGNEALICPSCAHTRKKKNLKTLTWYHDERHGKCHHCGDVYVIFRKKFEGRKYERPALANTTELSDNAVRYFETRGISQTTLKLAKVTTGTDYMPELGEVETIHFNYFRGGELINIKYRAKGKSFKIFKNGELIFYNLDAIKDKEKCYIVEGEVDALTLIECGYYETVSVPNGASNFQFLDNCFELLEDKKQIILAVDNDEAGIKLRNELIRRLGSDRCLIVNFGDCKDANEYMLKHGKSKLCEVINAAEEIPMDGVIFLHHVWDNMLHTYRNGKNFGTTTYYEKLDVRWKWRTGEVNVWTGYNSEGKSLFLNQLAIKKAENEGKRFAIFSPENYPVGEYYDELIHTFVGRSTDKRYPNVMSEQEYVDAAEFIENHFFCIVPEENYQLETILTKMKWLIGKYGINHCIFDPYNQIEHLMERGEREDLYISRFMTRLKKFAVDNDVSVHLIAHQVTPLFTGNQDYPEPDIYKIKGGGTFSDKADNVIAVWRPFRKSNFEDTTVKIIVAKVKKHKLVGIPGVVDFDFDFRQNSYREKIEV